MFQKKIGFLFGAGISITLGYPTTNKITEKVLSGEGYVRHTNSTYVKGKFTYAKHGFKEEYIYRTKRIIKILKKYIDTYYYNWRNKITNYEDIYYMAEQIHDCILDEYDNPAIQPLIDSISPELEKLLKRRQGEITENWNKVLLLMEVCNYIHDIVANELTIDSRDLALEKLNFLIECYNSKNISNIEIYTLNNDLALEYLLEKNSILYTDGFGPECNGVRYWKYDRLKSTENKVRLLKLHGSINWYNFVLTEGKTDKYHIGLPVNSDVWHTISPTGQDQIIYPARPLLLIGRFNKILNYVHGIYQATHYYFYESSRTLNRLVISGYSFGDKAINSYIINWLQFNIDNRIILIHGNINSLKKQSRPAFGKRMEEWIETKKLIVIDKWIENVNCEEIISYF